MHLLLLKPHAVKNICKNAFFMYHHTTLVNIFAFAISYAIFMHLGSEEEITLLEFDEVEEGTSRRILKSQLLKARSRSLRSFRSVLTTAPLPFCEASPGAF